MRYLTAVLLSRTSWSYLLGASATLTLLANPAIAFDSYGAGGGSTGSAVHGEITEDATKRLGINDCDDLQEAVRAPDWEQNSIVGLRIKPNDTYQARSHFDRAPSKTSKQAFAEAADYVRTEHEKCVQFAKMGNPKAARASLGRVLHAVQDLVSHSNLIDLPNDQREATWSAIWDSDKTAPDALRLTGYDPAAKEPGAPDGDEFGHDKFSKDNSKKNVESQKKIDGKTKFKIAYGLAVDYSDKILSELKDQLSDDDWKDLAKTFD